MRIAVVAGEDGSGELCRLHDDGTPSGPVERVPDLAAAVRDREGAEPRWVWGDPALYPALLKRGVRPARCHDVAHAEAILLGCEQRFGEPATLAAAWARRRGLPVPAEDEATDQALLFEPERPGLDAVVEVHAGQLARIAASGTRVLTAAESAGTMVAAEMTDAGLPLRRDVHDRVLTGLLGPRPAPGMRPARLQELADGIAAAFGAPVNPDSPAQLLDAFKKADRPVPSTRAHVLKEVDHPAVPLLLRYKELSRLHSAHGWAWADAWAASGRFRPEYVVGGVVSGRWATKGGGALQIPKILRRAVVADDGWQLVVADAAQLEPRILAALSGDRGMTAASGEDDLYAGLARAFGGERDRAKIALLSAMYGGASGEALQLLAIMRQRFPSAWDYVEEAARTGEQGRPVRSRLGRTSPPPSRSWRDLVSGPGEAGRRAMRDRGRFTRNFVVQASAADWALVLLAVLRRRLPEPARLVFFQHDEVIVHCPAERAGEVRAAVHAAGKEASGYLFAGSAVRFPLQTAAVDCYADAK